MRSALVRRIESQGASNPAGLELGQEDSAVDGSGSSASDLEDMKTMQVGVRGPGPDCPTSLPSLHRVTALQKQSRSLLQAASLCGV